MNATIDEPIVSRWVKTMPNRASVVAKIDDWIRRLNELYDQLDEWCEGIEGIEIERGTVLQLEEYWMKKFHVTPRKLPTYTIFCDNRRKAVKFVPSFIWVVGSNGRITVLSKSPYKSLHNVADDGQPSDWNFESWNIRKPWKPLDQALFQKLLKGAK